jgi:nitrite reductase (NO-forming)
MEDEMVQRDVLARRVAALRIAFGLIWAVDAGFKWTGSFVHGFRDTISSAGQGQPSWLRPWFHFWLKTVGNHGTFFAYATAAAETVLAFGLIFGFGRRIVYALAFVFGLWIWAIPEGFGGPYSSGSTDIGAGVVYAVVAAALYGLDTAIEQPAWAVDAWIERRWPGWRLVAEPAGRRTVDAASASMRH